MATEKAQRMTKRVADVLIETLQAAGVKNCYGIVGDTLNRIAHAIDLSEINWVHMRHEEAGAFAAQAEAQLTGRLTACAGSCGPGSLHFINGLYEANRNRAPVILIASQIMRKDLGFESIQEVDFQHVYQGCSVYCDMILTPDQARRKGAGFLVPHMDPLDLAFLYGVGDPVQRVADDPIAVLHPGGLQGLDENIRHPFAHFRHVSCVVISCIDRRPAGSCLGTR